MPWSLPQLTTRVIFIYSQTLLCVNQSRRFREDAMKRQSVFILVSLLLSALFLTNVTLMISAEAQNSFETNLEALEEKLVVLPWVSYAPANMYVDFPYPNETEIRKDLQLLYDTGFRGVITYACDGTLVHVPRIAREIGFQGVILGVYLGYTDRVQVENAKSMAEYVDGYCVGNEALELTRQHLLPIPCNLTYLNATMNEIRANTSKPVTTSEPGDHYLVDVNVPASTLRKLGDWLLPNYAFYPFWQTYPSVGREPAAAADLVVDYYNDLSALEPNKTILIKETGYPSAGKPVCNETSQTEFFRLLHNTSVNFAYFEAFDQPWKTWASVEPHWGLFKSDRTPKEVVSYLSEYFSVDTVAPSITVISPENTTYTTNSVSLNFTVNEPTSWIGYSLDGQANVTVTGNTTLSGLSDGSHSLIVYANDTAGNTGASEIVYFTIKSGLGALLTWIVVAIVIIAAFGTVLYLLKIRRRS